MWTCIILLFVEIIFLFISFWLLEKKMDAISEVSIKRCKDLKDEIKWIESKIQELKNDYNLSRVGWLEIKDRVDKQESIFTPVTAYEGLLRIVQSHSQQLIDMTMPKRKKKKSKRS